MKKWIVLLLVLILLAVPVCAENTLVHDEAGLLTQEEVARLEELYNRYPEEFGFTPVLVCASSLNGMTGEAYASGFYDQHGYPEDGVLLLVCVEDGQWYILTNGRCHDNITDDQAAQIGETIVPVLSEGKYCTGFELFPALSASMMDRDPDEEVYYAPDAAEPAAKKAYGRIIITSMGVGLLIGFATVGIMAIPMRSVKTKHEAADYVRSGSMTVTDSRDIYLYSHVRRAAKPKPSSSGGGHGGGGRSGGNRGGAGGRL